MSDSDTTNLFTRQARAYAKYRSGYPSEMIREILQPFNTGIHAVDIGAGTGISSRLLAQAGCKVIAVEPNKAMADAAEPHPNLDFRIAPAESTGLANNCADLVGSFQAFHWFSFSKSLREFNRLLKKDGRLALVWSYWNEEDPLTRKYLDMVTRATNKNKGHVSPYDGFPSGFIKKWRIRSLWKLKTLPYFKNVKRHHYIHTEEMDENSLIGLAFSQSYLAHEGPLWDELCENIRNLVAEESVPNRPLLLSYKVNLFTASPVK